MCTTNTVEEFLRQIRKVTKKRSIYFLYSFTEIDLFGHTEYPEKMNQAIAELESYDISVIHQVWRHIETKIIKTSLLIDVFCIFEIRLSCIKKIINQ